MQISSNNKAVRAKFTGSANLNNKFKVVSSKQGTNKYDLSFYIDDMFTNYQMDASETEDQLQLRKFRRTK